MKYFSHDYWFKLWIWSNVIFNHKITSINTQIINNTDIEVLTHKTNFSIQPTYQAQIQAQAFTDDDIKWMTEEQIPSLKESWIKALTRAQIKELLILQIQALTPEQISWFTPKQLAAFIENTLSDLETQQMNIRWQQIMGFKEPQIKALTPSQINVLKSEQIQAFPYWQFAWFTKDQIQSFTTDQIKVLTEEQIKALTQPQISSFTEEQIKAFTTHQIRIFKYSQFTWFTKAQIKVFTEEQIKAFPYWQFPLFTEEQIKAFTKDQISSFTEKQISWFTEDQILWFTEDQIKAFPYWQFPLFTENQIKAFTQPQISWFTEDQIQAFTNEQISWFTEEQISWFTKAQIKAFTEDQIKWFTQPQISSFTEDQIQAFTNEQISWFIEDHISGFTEDQIKAFTQPEISSFTEEQIKAFTKDQISSFTEKQISWFTKDQISWFTEDQIKALPYWQFPLFTENQIKAFTQPQISWFTEDQIKAFTNEQISWFTEEQISWFTKDQIQSLTIDQIKVLTEAQIKAFTTQQIRSLTREQKEAIDKKQSPVYTIEQILNIKEEKKRNITAIQISDSAHPRHRRPNEEKTQRVNFRKMDPYLKTDYTVSVDIVNDCYDEYLYAATNEFTFNKTMRRVFTWRVKGEPINHQGFWKLEKIQGYKDKYTIINDYYSEYLYAEEDYFDLNQTMRRVLTSMGQEQIVYAEQRWKIHETKNNNCKYTITNDFYNEDFCASNDKWSYSQNRRNIFTIKDHYRWRHCHPCHWRITSKNQRSLTVNFLDVNKNLVYLGIIDNNNEHTIKNAVRKQYNTFFYQFSIEDKTDFSYLCNCFTFKVALSIFCYSHKLKPTFSYITKSEISDLLDTINNNNSLKKLMEDVKEWENNLENRIKKLRYEIEVINSLYRDQKEKRNDIVYSKKIAFKNEEKLKGNGYSRELNLILNSIHQDLRLGELNKNLQGLEINFEVIKNTVNNLEKNVNSTISNQTSINCANVGRLVQSVAAAIPLINKVSRLTKPATITNVVSSLVSAFCAITGI